MLGQSIVQLLSVTLVIWVRRIM